jgi:hypothetical protein
MLTVSSSVTVSVRGLGGGLRGRAGERTGGIFGLQNRKLTRSINVGAEPRRVASSEQGKIGAISNMAGYVTFVR